MKNSTKQFLVTKLQSNIKVFVTLFGNEYEKIAPAPNSGLAGVFSTPDLREEQIFFNKPTSFGFN